MKTERFLQPFTKKQKRSSRDRMKKRGGTYDFPPGEFKVSKGTPPMRQSKIRRKV